MAEFMPFIVDLSLNWRVEARHVSNRFYSRTVIEVSHQGEHDRVEFGAEMILKCFVGNVFHHRIHSSFDE